MFQCAKRALASMTMMASKYDYLWWSSNLYPSRATLTRRNARAMKASLETNMRQRLINRRIWKQKEVRYSLVVEVTENHECSTGFEGESKVVTRKMNTQMLK